MTAALMESGPRPLFVRTAMALKDSPHPNSTEVATELVLSGEVTVSALSDLRAAFLLALESPTPLRVNAEGLSYIDAAGLQLLCSLQCECQLQGRPLEILPPSDSVLRDAERLGLRQAFTIHGAH